MAFEVLLKPVESLLFRGDVVAVGKFRCPTGHPLFTDSGPCSHHTFVFPRTVTAIKHEGREEFIGTPGRVLFYNQGQLYRRRPISAIDASDWYTVAEDVLLDVLAGADPYVRERPGQPFAIAERRVEPVIQAGQRALFESLRKPAQVDPLDVEERVIALLRASIGSSTACRSRAALGSLEVSGVEATRELLGRHPERNDSLRILATRAGLTPFGLCRAFRARTGQTLTAYRHSLRLAIALERLRDPHLDLTTLALDLGYSSHSHFTARFRRHYGAPPSQLRARS